MQYKTPLDRPPLDKVSHLPSLFDSVLRGIALIGTAAGFLAEVRVDLVMELRMG